MGWRLGRRTLLGRGRLSKTGKSGSDPQGQTPSDQPLRGWFWAFDVRRRSTAHNRNPRLRNRRGSDPAGQTPNYRFSGIPPRIPLRQNPLPNLLLLLLAHGHPVRDFDISPTTPPANLIKGSRANRHARRIRPLRCFLIRHHFTCNPSLSQPSWPSFSMVSIFFSKISAASGKASTARSIDASRSRCKVG